MKPKTRNKTIILILLVIVVSAFYLLKEKNSDEMSRLINDPFYNVQIPQDIDKDIVLRMENDIELTKQKYEKTPDSWTSWIAVGNVYSMIGDFDNSILAYRQSIVLNPQNILGYTNIAETYRVNLKNYVKAEEFYNLAIENNLVNPSLYITLSKLQKNNLDNNISAEKTLLEGLENTERDVDVLLAAIGYYEDTNQIEKTKEFVGELLQRYPENKAFQERWGSIIE